MHIVHSTDCKSTCERALCDGVCCSLQYILRMATFALIATVVIEMDPSMDHYITVCKSSHNKGLKFFLTEIINTDSKTDTGYYYKLRDRYRSIFKIQNTSNLLLLIRVFFQFWLQSPGAILIEFRICWLVKALMTVTHILILKKWRVTFGEQSYTLPEIAPQCIGAISLATILSVFPHSNSSNSAYTYAPEVNFGCHIPASRRLQAGCWLKRSRNLYRISEEIRCNRSWTEPDWRGFRFAREFFLWQNGRKLPRDGSARRSGVLQQLLLRKSHEMDRAINCGITISIRKACR